MVVIYSGKPTLLTALFIRPTNESLWFTSLQTLIPKPTIRIYPNPARTELNLNLSNTETSDISISNILGQVLIHSENQNRIDISSLTNGVYIIAITQGQFKQTQKLIKE